MARPKRAQNEASAQERIENAFWELLKNGMYSDITIRALALTAGVNHNLIYYYYENIDDLAYHAFHNVISEEALELVFDGLQNGNISIQRVLALPNLLPRFAKVQLYLRGDSAYLSGLVKETIRKVWLRKLNRTEETLTEEESVDLDFIIAGLFSVITTSTAQKNPTIFLSLLQRELGEGIQKTLKRISEK